MVLNYIFVAFFLIAFAIALFKLIVLGDMDVFPAMMNSTFDSAKTGFEISLGLTGVLSLWLGIMNVGEKGGIVNVIARILTPVFSKLFPDIPKGHPVTGSIFMNIAANMLGLDNAATPLGLKAMEQMQTLNQNKTTASNPMIMFLVLNTSGLTLIPVSIMVYRAQLGAAQPTDIFIPIGEVKGMAKNNSNTMELDSILAEARSRKGGSSAQKAPARGGKGGSPAQKAPARNGQAAARKAAPAKTIIVGFFAAGIRKKVNIYETFIEGAKDGFTTAVRIIPYLVAILVAIGVFRASGAMDAIIGGIGYLVEGMGLPNDWVGALPTALMKPLSGSGARGMMVDAMTTYGADSFIGRLSCIFQGSTDTTFYILAVYFGSVGIKNTRHAVACGLLADIAGIIAAIAVAYLFFG